MRVKESFVIRISGSSSNLRLAESQISGWVSGIAAREIYKGNSQTHIDDLSLIQPCRACFHDQIYG